MSDLPAHLSKAAIVEEGQRRTREEAEAFGLSLTEYVADVTAPASLGFTIDIPCACGGTGIRERRHGKTIYCRCAEGLEAAMRVQVELMTAYAERLRLYDEARRRGHIPPFRRTERDAYQSLFDAAQAEHDRLEARWQRLYG